ncbi:MAG: DEAD/DEAH box helicase family protein [Deltaproteobacteria bacterium]|jgi:predicted helicase|nr:DEAD/DEAH box helicase family protein [Deltaproteobacteria bacterium]
MTFHDILLKYQSQSLSQSEQGTYFEKLMANFLKTYPVYEQKFKTIWLWNSFPFRHDINPGGHDIGIDLVALTEDDEYWAVQCKCYKPEAYIEKPVVDSFIGASGKRFKDDTGQTRTFDNRLWISTTNKWSAAAENEIRNQDIPCFRLSLSDLETAPVDWEKLDQGVNGQRARLPKKILRPHQITALEKTLEHFLTKDRGIIAMACGTGKTIASLRIAESQTKGRGLVLFLAPSIALISQTLTEWSTEALNPIHSICVCSDPTVSEGDKKIQDDQLSFGVENLALPASTNVESIVKQIRKGEQRFSDRLTVVFSTYQSIDRVSEALKKLNKTVDLIICDEAHRTTGAIFEKPSNKQTDKQSDNASTKKEMKVSDFVKVHDDAFIKATKRLYMTATPRIYHPDSKKKAEESSIILCSMDDEKLYGEEIYRLGFGEAVDLGLLSDYKVLILTVNRGEISKTVDRVALEGPKEIETDDVNKLIGCLNALSKNMSIDGRILSEADPGPMRRAVAFCQTIAKSKRVSELWKIACDKWLSESHGVDSSKLVNIKTDHIDGSMGAGDRGRKLDWLKKSDSPDSNECKVLCNVRCLSEGIDVASLDAILFLSAKNSQIDVVQSVGRVMRKAEGKRFGYIVIPIVIPNYVDPNDALDDNKPFEVVWTVLNALKSHDDRFQATVNRLQLNEKKPDGTNLINIGSIAYSDSDDNVTISNPQQQDLFKTYAQSDYDLHGAIYARLVTKLAGKRDMLIWAQDVAKIAEGFENRITKVISQEGPHKAEFDNFLKGLRKSLNPSITSEDAVEMLAQHLITKPVFEALFDYENYSFVQLNPVSKSLEAMIDVLDDQGLEKDKVVLSRFYKTVKDQVAGIDTLEAKQRIIVKLYDNFFRYAAPKAVDKLGIVYTPIEIVDFIIHSVAEVLKREFGRDIADPNISILDPFSGTGTFITRLIQSGLLKESIDYKYASEIYANEIMLLPYYISSVNIENAYHAMTNNNEIYKLFNGICLTDSFQIYEDTEKGKLFDDKLLKNSERVEIQKNAPIKIILGNPPYSVGQNSANDNAQNQNYPFLHKKIASSYAAFSSATLKNSLYDSYIKAFRWATDRLDSKTGGIIAFVTNAGWLDGNATDGLRKCFSKEFSQIYVYNLRGNCRTSGELRKKESGNVFGLGSRTPIAITMLVKKPQESCPAKIHYHDIGDYLSRENKLAIIAENHDIYNSNITWTTINPNESGDWINKGMELFAEYTILGDKKDKDNLKSFFIPKFSAGLKTSRDIWCYNFSIKLLSQNIKSSISFYNSQVESFLAQKSSISSLKAEDFISFDTKLFSWDYQQKIDINNGKTYTFNNSSVITSLYRPFQKQVCYFNRSLNNRVYLLPSLFPSKAHQNLVICVPGPGGNKEFTPLITNLLPDLHFNGDSQCFPRYYYEPFDERQKTIFTQVVDGYVRHDAITDYIHNECKVIYDSKVSKDDIFYYVYGLLHSEDYRTAFSNDLKKSLPRLPLVDSKDTFMAFVKAGRDLADLHINYESAKPYLKVNITGDQAGDFDVVKMRFGKDNNNKEDKSIIYYNNNITISGVPLEAYEYVVNGKSALEWILENYQITTDTESGIKNDPNLWAQERDEPRYILDLLLKVITVSLETMKIVKNLPKLEF